MFAEITVTLIITHVVSLYLVSLKTFNRQIIQFEFSPTFQNKTKAKSIIQLFEFEVP